MEKESEIIDYLLFPCIYFYVDQYYHMEDDPLKIIIEPDYLEFTQNMKVQLEDSKEAIDSFYQKDIYSNVDFFHILISAYPVYDYQDAGAYFEDLLSVDDGVFKQKLMQSLMSLDEDETIEETVTESDALSYINGFKIDSAEKWHLLMIIQEPKKQLRDFIALLKKNEHLFYDYYKTKKQEIHEVGEKISSYFSEDTLRHIKKLTYNSIDYDFSVGECAYFYVSCVLPYSLRLSQHNPLRMIWGLDMEKSLRMINDINEDKLAQRVKAFKTLGDRTRYETLRLLSQGVDSVKEIAQILDVSSATISYHINEYITSGIVHIRRGKKEKSTYKVDYHRINQIIRDFKNDLNFK